MTALWTVADLVSATGGRPIGVLPSAISGISIDTRTLSAGDAFFAIKGERFDGHDFLTAATAAGAGVLVVSEQKLPALGKATSPLLVVVDVLKALERLAAAARSRATAKIIAVTGSVGKTTTKEALRQALAPSGTVHASSASFNNHWGVPLSLARLPSDADYAVFEIGMNHPGEIRPLVKLVRPHVAIVTLIAPAHLGHFRDLGEIATAKGEIFEGVEVGGAALVNADDPHCDRLTRLAREAGIARIATFGEVAGADERLLSFEDTVDGSFMKARIEGEEVEVRLKVPGRHIAQNILAVLGATALAGGNVSRAAAALEDWSTGKGRGARHRLGPVETPILVIDESYNANPASMRAALKLLKSATPAGAGRRIAVLGDMLELGGHSRRLHMELAEPVIDAGTEAVFLIGEEIRPLTGVLDATLRCEWHSDRQELQASLSNYLRPGDIVVIKASNGIGLSALVESLIKNLSANEAVAPGVAPLDISSGSERGPC